MTFHKKFDTIEYNSNQQIKKYLVITTESLLINFFLITRGL